LLRALTPPYTPFRAHRSLDSLFRVDAPSGRAQAGLTSVPRQLSMRPLLIPVLAALAAAPLTAQTIDDGFPVERRQLRLSLDHGMDRWDEYWEGTRKRSNENIGTVTTRSTTMTAGYGVTGDLSVWASVPYITTNASQGVLAGQQGAQDLTLAAKWRALKTPFTSRGSMHLYATGMIGTPVSDYTPDFMPMSIGLAARRATVRGMMHYEDKTGLFLDGAIARTWRSNVTLDRPAYYTNGQLTLSNEVAMPDQVEYMAMIGIAAGRLCLPLSFIDTRTLGGGDIRRQDMPFVSNRMNQQRVQLQAMYDLPWIPQLRVSAGAVHVLHGRNVGQGTMVTGGVTYSFGPLKRGLR
jgi:hypothetical protein